MEFKGEITVAAPRAEVYARIRDAEFFVSCIEGVRDLEVVDDTHYTAVMENGLPTSKCPSMCPSGARDEAPNIEAKSKVGQ